MGAEPPIVGGSISALGVQPLSCSVTLGGPYPGCQVGGVTLGAGLGHPHGCLSPPPILPAE